MADQAAVLVIDDDELERDLLTRRLTRYGYRVESVADAPAALALLHTHSFDLVLLDTMMPDVSNAQVLNWITSDPHIRHIPVVVISSGEDLDSVVRCIERGAEDYLLKPFSPVLLRARIAASVEKKRLRDREQALLRAVTRERELGRRIQSDFLPDVLPQPPGWEIAAAFHPAGEIAGDFYDVFELTGGRIALVIADVCGKGVPAALFMALFRSLIRAYAEHSAALIADQRFALQAVALTNEYIVRHHYRGRRMFATLFFGVLDPHTGKLDYINAGHEVPILRHADGTATTLQPTGPAVGVVPDATFGDTSVTLASGDLLLACTDGVTEARSPTRDLFSDQRLLTLLATPPAELPALLAQIEAAVRAHVALEQLSDDVTLLALKRLVV